MPPLSLRKSALDNIGDRDAPVGSAPWARWFVIQARKCCADLTNEAAALRRLIDKLESGEAWKALGIASFSMLCELEIGLNSEEIEAIRKAKAGQTIAVVLGKRGRPRKGEEKVSNTNFKASMCNAAYLHARLRRDRPDLADRFEAGEFPSVRSAALEAGIVERSFQCPNDPVKAARRILRHFQGDRLIKLIEELSK